MGVSNEKRCKNITLFSLMEISTEEANAMMEITEEEDTMIYIYFSKKRIDDMILNNDYQSAFQYLIMVLGRLDDNNKKNVIDYYSNKLLR